MLKKASALLTAWLLAILPMQAEADQKNRTAISTEIQTLFPDNSAGQITPQRLRSVTGDINDSSVNKSGDSMTGSLNLPTLAFNPGSLPGFATEGLCAWSSAGHNLQCYDGTAWNAATGSGGGGSGTPGGLSGQLQFNNGGLFGGFALAGDCTIAVPTITCLKTNGVNFGPLATATNVPVSAMNGGVNASSATFWRGDGTWASASGGGGVTGNFDITAAAYGGCTTASTDAASCINSAMTACSNAGGGKVWVPAGRWTVLTQIVVPKGCSLNGTASPPFNYSGSALNIGGSILVVNWGSGANTAANAAIKLAEGAGVKSLGFDYPGQSGSGTTWGSTILAWGGANVEQFVEDCFFLKSWIAIDFRGSVENTGLAHANIVHNRGAVISIGVALDFAVDAVNIIDNTFNSGWIQTSQGTTLTNAMSIFAANNGTGYFLGGADGVNLINDSAWGYSVGVTVAGGSGYASPGKGPYQITNSFFDMCQTGVLISGHVSTVQASNNWFVSKNANSGAAGASVSVQSGVNFDSGQGGLVVTNNFMWGGNNLVWAAQASQTLGYNTISNNLITGSPGTAPIVLTGNVYTSYVGNAVTSGYAAPSVTGGTFDTGGGGSSGTAAQFTATGSTTPQFSLGSTTGVYGTAGSTVGFEISGTPILSAATSGVNIASGYNLAASGSIGQFQGMEIVGSGVYGFNDQSTGIYGTSGSTVGAEISGTVMWSTYGTSFQLGTGISALKDGGGSWTASSDRRVKKDIADYKLGLDAVKALRPVSFEYNGKYGTSDDGKTYVGVIAQEVQKTPLAAMVGSRIDQKTGEKVLTVDNSQLVYALVNAVVTLSNKVDQLEKKVKRK